MPVWLKQQQQKNKTPSASLINQLLFKMLNSIQRKNEFTSTLTLLKTTGSIQTIETLEDLNSVSIMLHLPHPTLHAAHFPYCMLLMKDELCLEEIWFIEVSRNMKKRRNTTMISVI